MFGVKPSLNLKYPKKLGIKRGDVERERKKMNYPTAWKISEDKKNYYMRASKKILKREIMKKGSGSRRTILDDPFGSF